MSFSAYLINTYDVGVGSRPILRSYIAFDYTSLPTSLGSLRPFIGKSHNCSIRIADNISSSLLLCRLLWTNPSSPSIQQSIFTDQCRVLEYAREQNATEIECLDYVLSLAARSTRSFFTGARFLSQCEVTSLQQTQFNNANPRENLNDLTSVSFATVSLIASWLSI